MLMTVKRSLALFLALMMCLGTAVLFASCEKTPADNTDESGDSSVEETEAPVILGDFEITAEVKILRADKCDDTIKAAAEALAKAIQENLGFTCRIVTDWNYRESAEIMVGECGTREDSVEFNDCFYPEGYGYAVLSEEAINISAHNTENVYRAVQLFISEVIEKATVKLQVGTDSFKNNERPDVNYTINGQALDSFVIVAEDVAEASAVNLRKYIDDYLLSELKIVTPAEYKGGNAIKIGSFGADSCFGYRYRVGSSVENGSVVITVDGENETIREAATSCITHAYLNLSNKKSDFVFPEETYGYRTSSFGGSGLYQVSSEEKVLAEGVTYYRKHYNNQEDKNVDVFITAVSGDSKAQFGTYVAEFDTSKDVFEVKTVGLLARGLESTGVNVLAACNAGYFHLKAKTYKPYGMQIVDGVEIWAPNGADWEHADNWVGITFDGKMVTGDAKDYENTYKGKLEYGIACGAHLMKDGKIDMQKRATGLSCYTAVALTADNGFVIICVDGRPEDRNGKSQGCSGFDVLTLLWDLGLEYTDVYILDGGGSTEMVLEKGKYFYTQNDPSDGKSRPVSDIIAVIIPKE